jgi:transcription antitermination protein NusB
MPAVNRRTVREAVIQTIFECEFREISEGWWEIFEERIAEFGVNYEQDFAKELLNAVFDNMPVMKEWIEKLAPNWPFSKIAKLDASVLLVGLAELKFLDKKFEIPTNVTLNEFVEIAKNYGEESDRRFVNGVLSSAQRGLEK